MIGHHFAKNLGQIDITSFLTGQQLVIEVKKGSEELECRIKDTDMHPQLKQIFVCIDIFFACFKKLCQEWNSTNNHIFLCENKSLGIVYTQRVMKVQVKRKIFLMMYPKQQRDDNRPNFVDTQEGETKQEMSMQELQHLINECSNKDGIKVCIKQIWKHTKINTLKTKELANQNQQLRDVLKQMEFQIYRLSVKNNELTINLNKISHAASRQFELLETFVKEQDKKNSQNSQSNENYFDLQNIVNNK